MPSLEITTVIGCPLMCTVCPQNNLISNYKSTNKYLTFEIFKTVLNKIPKFVRIDFSGMSEPWVNKDCTKMFELTLKSNYDVAIYTTLVGMNRNDTDKVIDLIENHKSQIKVLCVHLPDKEGNMRGWKETEEYHYALKNILKFKDESFFQAMTMNYNEEVNESIKSYDIKLVNYNKNWLAHTRAGSLLINERNKNITLFKKENVDSVSCRSTPFYDHNVLLPNGDVVLCCMDYSLKHIIGNLINNDYESLYLSDEMIKIMKENKKQEYSKCSICKSCDNVINHKVVNNTWS